MDQEAIYSKVERILMHRTRNVEPVPMEIIRYFVRGIGVDDATRMYCGSRGNFNESDENYVRNKYLVLAGLCGGKQNGALEGLAKLIDSVGKRLTQGRPELSKTLPKRRDVN